MLVLAIMLHMLDPNSRLNFGHMWCSRRTYASILCTPFTYTHRTYRHVLVEIKDNQIFSPVKACSPSAGLLDCRVHAERGRLHRDADVISKATLGRACKVGFDCRSCGLLAMPVKLKGFCSIRHDVATFAAGWYARRSFLGRHCCCQASCPSYRVWYTDLAWVAVSIQPSSVYTQCTSYFVVLLYRM